MVSCSEEQEKKEQVHYIINTWSIGKSKFEQFSTRSIFNCSIEIANKTIYTPAIPLSKYVFKW